MYNKEDHTFVICAYKKSKYLEEMIQSLMNQTIKGKIILSTSTPNDMIEKLCKKYNIKMYVNLGESSIAKDWNYGYNIADTALVTIAHQDDYYEPTYLENVLQELNKPDLHKVQIVFSDYYEIRKKEKVYRNKLLVIKRIMLFPLKNRKLASKKFIKRRILSFGNPICCPSVTLVKKNIGKNAFDDQYVNSCDYKTWETLSKKEGMFLYIPKCLMAHRIHEESTTTKNVVQGIRKEEDLKIMCEFWPSMIASVINRIYSKSEKSNKV